MSYQLYYLVSNVKSKKSKVVFCENWSIKELLKIKQVYLKAGFVVKELYVKNGRLIDETFKN